MHTNRKENFGARKIKADLALRGWTVSQLISHLPKRAWRGERRRPSRNAVSRAINTGACPQVLELIKTTLGL